ncbi:MAG: TIGR04282 family arsenosugar biosynthesis glycosyltransferase [Candidatus Wenzhouxiangella sp. M2_3B_020]
MTAIAVFVKTPGLSPIKTRLARRVGRQVAEEWHRRAAGCVGTTAAATGLPVYWAIAEEDGMQHPLWRHLPRIAQGEGGLGSRMARVHTEIVQRHGAGILIGADLPQIEGRHLETAATWLDARDARHVLGPARDGGFWLFGANRALPGATWESVDYSRADTGRRLIAAIDAPVWQLLERKTDLDLAGDLPTVLAELEAVPKPTPEQEALAHWLELRTELTA